VTADYGGRYLWELIQNADDALAYGDRTADVAELIGTKGLGFISVLEITDRQEIFSRPFAFYFSKADTEALLRTRLGKDIRAPTFEIPHPATRNPPDCGYPAARIRHCHTSPIPERRDRGEGTRCS
jgi:hypothetical protein